MSIIESITNAITGADEASIYVSNADSGSDGHLVFSAQGVVFQPLFNRVDFQEFPADSIVDIAIESSIEKSQRFTLTRLFFLDKYAMALPKKTESESVMIGVIMSDGSRWGYVAKDGSSQKIYRQIQRYLENYTGELGASSGPSSMAEELSELSRLHKQGVLNDTEFSQAKQQVIDRWGQS
ncbi:hypothetical protein GX865_00900 [Candidatus Saccharibacteria bacterium]|jgi:hypothetical protein|nr:hypothetical protein [Candidatus Saccharibacteria bacterium]